MHQTVTEIRLMRRQVSPGHRLDNLLLVSRGPCLMRALHGQAAQAALSVHVLQRTDRVSDVNYTG
jgi:hypothetical protein